MNLDPIVEEVRAYRDANAAKFGYDLKAICADQRQNQRRFEQEGWVFQTPAQYPQNRQ